MAVLWFQFCLHFQFVEINFSRGQKQTVWLLCWWREELTFYYSSPCFANPVQSSLYFIRCRNDQRIMFKSFACDWSNWSDEKRVKNSNILNRKIIFGQRKLQTHELHSQDETIAFFRVGERGKLNKFRRNMTRRMRHFQGNYRLLSCYWKKPLKYTLRRDLIPPTW